MIRKILFTLFIISACATAQEVPIHQLKPPILEQKNIGRHILCHRPMRYGKPKIEIESLMGKIIVHNYGHGGSGWTLAPGCTTFLVHELTIARDTPIVIVGAGVMGLFSAYELIKSGYNNITMIAEEFDDLVSHHAGGLLAPSTIQIEEGMQPLIEKICFDAYRFYAKIANGENEDFPSQAARIMPIYLKRHDTRLLSYESTVMKKPYDVRVDFGYSTLHEMKVYEDAIFMDTDLIMDSLTSFLKNRVKWMQKKIISFDEIDSPCIFNCTGLGAHHLNHDEKLVSVQGHLILLENQNPSDMTYMISFGAEPGIAENGQIAKRAIYLFPKHVTGSRETSIGILGGSFIENVDGSTPNEAEFELMIERAKEFFLSYRS